jgi:2-amino-4-hydroxy-6-hydroxymethyldihydropteridine diphosphokinase
LSVQALIGMGSNIEPEKHLANAALQIRTKFPGTAFSRVYRSKAVGMAGEDFLNACCLVPSEMKSDELNVWLKRLEDAHGRDRSLGSWQPRTLDLDLLMFGGVVLDDNLYRYAHAHVPAAELVRLSKPCENEAMLTRIDIRL